MHKYLVDTFCVQCYDHSRMWWLDLVWIVLACRRLLMMKRIWWSLKTQWRIHKTRHKVTALKHSNWWRAKYLFAKCMIRIVRVRGLLISNRSKEKKRRPSGWATAWMLSLRLSPCHYFSAIVATLSFLTIVSSFIHLPAHSLRKHCCMLSRYATIFFCTFVVLPSCMHAFAPWCLHSYFCVLYRFSQFFFLAIDDFYAFCSDCLSRIIALSPCPFPFVLLPRDNNYYRHGLSSFSPTIS
eukprot:SAG11_NODE_5522_length_1536_cov_2.286708_1_plen_239_part_00